MAMDTHAERLEFAPPQEPAAIRAFVVAVAVHLLLAAALTWGINWKKDVENVTAEAELWAAMPSAAAPPPPPVVEQAAVTPPVPEQPPAPEVKVETPAPPPPIAEPDIALEREKRKQELARQRAEEIEQQKKLEAKQRREELEREKKELLAQEKAAAKKAAEKAAEKASQDKHRKEELAKAQASEKTAAALRKDQLDRMRKLAGADPNATGNSSPTPSAGKGKGSSAGAPSAAYAARIAARIRPYIRHPQEVPGNPPVEIEVRTSPDGTIVGQRVIKSSGNEAWDESAIRAVISATTLPRNEEGRVISPITVILRQRDQ
ncbi:cell envelope integrity protein TolA [Caenimonas koreensis]|uniref:cell envelope integrity protein TolA n=1 Tax=Caenimonas koreensis TaxID=367474 RepID=UPI003783E7B7